VWWTRSSAGGAQHANQTPLDPTPGRAGSSRQPPPTSQDRDSAGAQTLHVTRRRSADDQRLGAVRPEQFPAARRRRYKADLRVDRPQARRATHTRFYSVTVRRRDDPPTPPGVLAHVPREVPGARLRLPRSPAALQQPQRPVTLRWDLVRQQRRTVGRLPRRRGEKIDRCEEVRCGWTGECGHVASVWSEAVSASATVPSSRDARASGASLGERLLPASGASDSSATLTQ
jgi:hypothetical protein